MNRFFLAVCILFTLESFGQVNLPSGSAEFNLPVFNWHDDKSRLNTIVTVNYSSGSGLKVNSVASNIGQGWNLIQGGVITRIQAGEPDDQKPYDGNGTSEDITKYPAGFLYDTATTPGYSDHLTRYPLFKDKNHIYKQHNETVADKQMDQFAYQFNGRSGLFVLGKSRTSEDVAFLGDGKLKLSYGIDESLSQQGIRTTITAFYIIDDQGLVYTFSKKETVKVLKTIYTDKDGISKLTQPTFKNDRVYYEKSVEGAANEIKNPYVVTAWYLDKIHDPLTGRSIRFYYHVNQIEAEAGYAFSHYASEKGFPPHPETYSIASHSVSYTQTPRIDSISLPDGHRVLFNYGADRIDMNGDKVLSAVSVTYKNRFLNKYLFKSTYIIRNRYGNPETGFQKKAARLFLRSITKMGPDLRAEEKPYTFDYFRGSGSSYDFVPPPFYHLKDIWGYYNGDNSKSAGNNLIDPDKPVSELSNMEIRGLVFLRGPGSSSIELNAKDGMAKNGLLRQINFPQGGSLNYEYEQNKAILNNQLTLVGGVHVSKTTTTDGGYSNDCNNPVSTAYQYTLADGVQPSYWGVEYPVNSVVFKNYYKPEKKRFKFFKLSCQYDFQYPGIVSRDNAVALTSGQKILTIVANIMGPVGTLLQVLDIIQFAAGATGPAAIIIDAISAAISAIVTCFLSPVQNTSMAIFYNNDLNQANPLPIQFKRVEVIPGDGAIGKTVHEFTSLDDYPVWFSSNPVYSMKQRYAHWAYGLPKSTTVYDNVGNKLNETIHSYDTAYARRLIAGCPKEYATRQMRPAEVSASEPCDTSRYISYKNLIIKNSSQRSDIWDDPVHYQNQSYTTDMTSNPDMKVEGYHVYTGRFLLKKTINRIYKKGFANQYAQTTTEYSYNNADCSSCYYDNYEVNEIKTTLSNGDINYQTFRYDHPFLYWENIFTVPFETTSSFQKAGSPDRYYTSETATEYKYAPNGNLVPWKIKAQRFVTPQPASLMHSYMIFDDPDPVYKTEKEFFYDSYGNLSGQKDEGGRGVMNIYDDDDRYVAATVIGADPVLDKAAYTSFETDDLSRSGWSFSGSKIYGNTGVTGYRALTLSPGKTLSTQLNTSKPHILSFWAASGLSVTGGATLSKSSPAINGFTYYEYKISQGTASVSITGSGDIDELRMYPANATMQTTTYDPVLGKIAECDQNNRIHYYEYDESGRLQFIKDENKDVIKMYEYNQKSKTVNCPGLYENLTVAEVFFKNNCGAGFAGTMVVYIIPAGKYSSTVSQEEVDFLVEKELAEDGQAYANTHGACTQIFTNDAMSDTLTKEGCDDGYVGTSVTYSVPAGKYTSTVSKADANQMAQDEIDANGQAFANAPGNASCVVDYTPLFIGEEDSPTQCQQAGGVNTGHVLILTKDVNPHSPTYNQTQWGDMGVNTVACPLPVPCAGCTGEDKKCIDNVCESGIIIYTGSYFDGTYKRCVYHYEWSDGSWSPNYYSAPVPPYYGCRTMVIED